MISWGKYNHHGIFHSTDKVEIFDPNAELIAHCGVYLHGAVGASMKRDYYMTYTVRPTCKNCKRVREARKANGRIH